MKISLYKTLCAIFSVSLLIGASLELVAFELWSQVLFLKGTSLMDINIYEEVHFLRYALVFPIFLLSDAYGLNYDYLFSILCSILIIVISLNISLIAKYLLCQSRINYKIFLIAIITMVSMSILMNGRMLYAMTGFSFLVLNVIRWENQKRIKVARVVVVLVVGVFLSSVSSGTFLVSNAFLFLWLIMRGIKRVPFSIIMAILLVEVLLLPITMLYFLKNVDYFGGGVEGVYHMLKHGVGIIIYSFDSLLDVLYIAIILVCAVYMIKLYFKANGEQPVLIAISTAFFGGVFGFSTLLVAMPVIIALLITRFLCRLPVEGSKFDYNSVMYQKS